MNAQVQRKLTGWVGMLYAASTPKCTLPNAKNISDSSSSSFSENSFFGFGCVCVIANNASRSPPSTMCSFFNSETSTDAKDSAFLFPFLLSSLLFLSFVFDYDARPAPPFSEKRQHPMILTQYQMPTVAGLGQGRALRGGRSSSSPQRRCTTRTTIFGSVYP